MAVSIEQNSAACIVRPEGEVNIFMAAELKNLLRVSAGKKQAGRQAGATGWIVQPFHAEQLLASVQKLSA